MTLKNSVSLKKLITSTINIELDESDFIRELNRLLWNEEVFGKMVIVSNYSIINSLINRLIEMVFVVGCKMVFINGM